MSDIKTELATCHDCSFLLELPEDHDLCVKLSELKTLHFYCCHSFKKILNTISSSTSPPSTGTDAKGLKIPKLEASTFDGDVLNWTHKLELRRLHDTLQQHLHALDAADCEPLSHFITSIIQLKLDPRTLFEW